jgi:MFS family permease
MNKNLWLLTLCQGLFLTNNIVFIAVNGLVGFSLAPYGWLATLPVMAYVLGGALSTGLVAKAQARLGRKASFQIGLLVALSSALLCATAAWLKIFELLVLATTVAGYYNANGSLYRFAAPELAGPAYKEKAVSWVLAGGLLGAALGPNLANYSRSLMSQPFIATYLALGLVAVLSFALLSQIEFPPLPAKKLDAQGLQDTGRPIGAIIRQPLFIVAALGAALGYGVMNLLMAATPLAMQVCGYPFSDAAMVLQWHVVGMFAPGFFTGHLIRRYGAPRIMALGVLLNLVCIGVALSGTEVMQFLWALLLLGVGWNFLFTASTTLTMQTYQPEERDKAQGALNFAVFGTLALTSLSSGVLINTQGWLWLNLASLLPVLVLMGAAFWLLTQKSRKVAPKVA